MKAIWNNQVIAESDDTIVVENNHYFPGIALSPNFCAIVKHKAPALGKAWPLTTPGG
jgi:uncharacterized protein (DUF427 family)